MSICQIDEDGTKRWRNSKNQLHREDGPAIEGSEGTNAWYKNGRRLLDDGPAIEYASGSKEWWVNGLRHREGGPAIELAAGGKWWYLNGQFHREDGPAIEYASGSKRWYLNGQNYSFKDYCNELLNRKLITEAALSLFRIKHGE